MISDALLQKSVELNRVILDLNSVQFLALWLAWHVDPGFSVEEPVRQRRFPADIEI